MGKAVSSVVVKFWATATGTSLTGLTVIETVAMAEFAVPSFTRKVKLSAPMKFEVGVKVTFGAVPLRVPLAGCVRTV